MLTTVPAVAVNVTVVAAAGTVTDVGTVSKALLLESETSDPPAGAAPESVTVQVEAALLARLAGAQTRLVRVMVGATNEIVAVLGTPAKVAVTVAAWLLAMTPAVAVNVAVVAAAGTVTDAGTVSKALLLESETSDPPAGAPLESVTVQVDAALLARLVGAQETPVKEAGASNEIVAVWGTPARVAVTVAV